MENKLLQTYENLPGMIRWILFLPVSLFLALAITFLTCSSAYIIGVPAFVFLIIFPVIFQITLLTAIFFTVPKWKLVFVLIFIALRSTFLAITGGATILLLLGSASPEVSKISTISSFIGETCALFFSLSLYTGLKELLGKDENQFSHILSQRKQTTGF